MSVRNAVVRAGVPEHVFTALGYLFGRLLYLNSRYAPQIHWGDIALALDGFPTDNSDLSSLAFWDEWRARWTVRADHHVQLADRSSTPAGRSRALRAAAACYHWAEFMYFEDSKEKLLLRRSIRECFLGSANASGLELTQHELAVGQDSVPYWVLLPPTRQRTALPAVILSNGLDSMTEVEILALAEPYLERGMAAVLFDGPGQGIRLGQVPLRIDMETVVAELVWRLRDDPRIDVDRLAFLGVSFGGYFALRIARALGDTFGCIINFGGGPRIAEFAGLPRRLKADFRFAFSTGETDDMQARFDALALEPAGRPDAEVRSVHGALDDIFPLAALAELDQAWGERHRLTVYEREAHTCMNVMDDYTQQIADWVGERMHSR